jgi:hypothetical protein
MNTLDEQLQLRKTERELEKRKEDEQNSFINKFGVGNLVDLVRELQFIKTPVLLFDNIYLRCENKNWNTCFFYKETFESDKINKYYIFCVTSFGITKGVYIEKFRYFDEVTAEKIIRYLLKKVDN